MKIVEAILALLIGLIGVLAFMVLGIVAHGWAFMVLWGWFMVPIFGLPALSLPAALGVSATIGFTTTQYVPSKKEDTWGAVSHIFAKPVVAVVVGAIIKSFM